MRTHPVQIWVLRDGFSFQKEREFRRTRYGGKPSHLQPSGLDFRPCLAVNQPVALVTERARPLCPCLLGEEAAERGRLA